MRENKELKIIPKNEADEKSITALLDKLSDATIDVKKDNILSSTAVIEMWCFHDGEFNVTLSKGVADTLGLHHHTEHELLKVLADSVSNGNLMNNPKYTHRKRSWHAFCSQWEGDNTDEILKLLNNGTISANLHSADQIIVRYGNTIDTISRGCWVVRGENDVVKCYDAETFKTKYETAL